MIKLLAKVAIALSLMLSASVAAPAWSAGKPGASKCHHQSKNRQAKRTTVATKPQPARSIMLVEQRKQDVQILSFGP